MKSGGIVGFTPKFDSLDEPLDATVVDLGPGKSMIEDLAKLEPKVNGKVDLFVEFVDEHGDQIGPGHDPLDVLENGGIVTKGNEVFITPISNPLLAKNKIQSSFLRGHKLVKINDGKSVRTFDFRSLAKTRFDITKAIPLRTVELNRST